MTKTHFVVRTIRDGSVVIDRMVFRPSETHKTYDGRLDGLRYAFGRYRDYEHGGWKPLAYLWGTEAQFKSTDPPVEGPHIVDGYLVWEFWNGTQDEAREAAND